MVSVEGLDAAFRKVDPDFDRLIVASRNHVWLVIAVIVFDEVHAAFSWASKLKFGVGLEMDQTLTVRSRQAVANVFRVASNIHIVLSPWKAWRSVKHCLGNT